MHKKSRLALMLAAKGGVVARSISFRNLRGLGKFQREIAKFPLLLRTM